MRPKVPDLRLLLVFEALLSERNVTRAAQRINLSQSATSKALARLRETFDDPLFLRTGFGVAPTHRALELAPRVEEALTAARDLLDPARAFDPASAAASFKMASTDYVSFVLMPALVPALAREAPNIRIAVQDFDTATAEETLHAGKVDFAYASVERAAKPLHRQELFRDTYVCVARRGHPGIGKTLTLKQFVAARHLVIPRQNGGALAVVDDALAQSGHTRESMVSIPHFLGIPQILASSDLLLTAPARVGQALARAYPLKVWSHPLRLPPFSVSQLWHARTDSSPSHRWLREYIARICRKI